MNKKEFIKQRCEIDKITEEEFEKQYRVVKCYCGQPYCKGYRCLDLDDLLKEMEQKAEEQKKDYLEALIIKHERAYEIEKLKEQQKVFIKYLENMLDDENDIFSVVRVQDVLQKYKEIIGNDTNVGSKGNKDD